MSYASKVIHSPAKAESEQKDVIIAQIKRDILELKRQQENYYDLKSAFQTLENRYALLEEEKSRNNVAYKVRNEQDAKMVSNLKQDLDSQNQMQRQKQIELYELKTNNQQLNEINQQKESEFQNFSTELNQTNDGNNRMMQQKSQLEAQLDQIQQEKKRLGLGLESLLRNNDQQLQRKNELDKMLLELNFHQGMLLKQINYTNRQNQQVKLTCFNQRKFRMEYQSKQENQLYLDQQRVDATNALVQLESDMASLRQILDQTQSESYRNNRVFQEEQARGLDLQKRLSNLESLVIARVSELNDLKNQDQRFRDENMELLNINQQLSADLDTIKAHIVLLADRNSLYLNDFNKHSQYDEQILLILNRKLRVKEMRYKTEEKINITLTRIQEKL